MFTTSQEHIEFISFLCAIPILEKNVTDWVIDAMEKWESREGVKKSPPPLSSSISPYVIDPRMLASSKAYSIPYPPDEIEQYMKDLKLVTPANEHNDWARIYKNFSTLQGHVIHARDLVIKMMMREGLNEEEAIYQLETIIANQAVNKTA